MTDPAAERKRRADRQGAGIIAITVIVVALLLYFYYDWVPRARPLGPDLCPTDGKPPASLVVVVIDTTDPLSGVQRQEVLNELERTIDELPQYAEVRLYRVESGGESPLVPVASVCNPGSGAGKSNLLWNPNLMGKTWRDRFVEPLKNELDKLLKAPSAATSPILESIQSIAAGAFDKPDFDNMPKRLIVVSDMVQNSSCLSQYRSLQSFDSFRKSACYLNVRPRLKDVELTVLYLRRSDVERIQGARHIEFWQEYFFDAGVKRVLAVTSIEGGLNGRNTGK